MRRYEDQDMMRNRNTALLLLLPTLMLLAIACGKGEETAPSAGRGAGDASSPASGRTDTPITSPAGSDTPPATASVAGAVRAEPVPDASYGVEGDLRFVRVPASDCMNITATPIVVGDWLVYPSHENRECRGNPGPYGRVLFGYNLAEGRLYQLYGGAGGEATPTFDAARETVFWPVTFGGSVFFLDAQALSLRQRMNAGTTVDSAGVVLDDLFYFGTVNSPDDPCQNPLNPSCGGIFAVDATGKIVHRRATEEGFRAWVGTSVTTDGRYLYWGTAAQTVGEKTGDETEYLYGCSVVKTDPSLNILASFDPGDLACYKLPFQGANEDSVAGEVVPDGSGLWAPYVRPNAAPASQGEFTVALYRLDLDLNERCRLEFPFQPQTQAVGFYSSMTVDAAGDAYLAISVPDQASTRRGLLYRVSPDCRKTLLAEAPAAFAHASPTLADDRYVLFATDGRLQVVTTDGEPVREYALASDAKVLAAPVLHDGRVYVLQEDGTLNIIEGSGLSGYGDAIWPRYRHDNAGSGRLDGARTTPGGRPTPAATSPGTGPAGAFIAFHLEVTSSPRIKALWPLLERFMELSDRYGFKVTLQFSWPWADYVYRAGLLEVVHGWEEEGHEIALHHHGPTHKFFDGYTDAPETVRTDGWYSTSYGYLGSMDELMALLEPLSQHGITSAGMSDEDTDWPAGVLYFATDSGETPSKSDLLSRPVETVHNGHPVVEIYNAGYEIGHLGDAAVSLEDVAAALDEAAADQYLGIVFNDETIEKDFALIEPLYELLRDAGVGVNTVSGLLSR